MAKHRYCVGRDEHGQVVTSLVLNNKRDFDDARVLLRDELMSLNDLGLVEKFEETTELPPKGSAADDLTVDAITEDMEG